MRTHTVHNVGHDIPVVTYGSDCLADDTQRVVVANGFVGGSLAGLFAQHLTAVATKKFEVSAYEEPQVGSGTYAESYRAEIFDKVVRSMGHQVCVLAHSRGTIAWSDAGPRLMDDELINGFAGLTPIGLSQLSKLSRFERYRRLSNEVVRPSIDTKDSAVMSARIAGHILRRFSHPVAAINEVDRTLQVDTTNSIVDTSQTVPTVMITGSRDRLVPSEEVQNCLDEKSGYQGSHVEISATHLDAFANSRHSAAIYEALHGIEITE